jgi:predicted O-linked N-acetylglucosamine transferase (SPINDLY family)
MMLANLCPECFAERDVQFTDPQAALNHAMGLHQAGRFADAAGIYQRLLELIPDSHDVRHLQGLALFDLGRPDEGIRLMEEALARNPGAGHYYNNLGSRLIDHGDLKRAEQLLTEGATRSPGCPATRYNLGNALFRQGKYLPAIACYREALALRPDFAMCDLQLGLALHNAGLRAEALTHYQAAVAAHPDDPALRINHGAMLQSECDLDGAAAAFREAVRLTPQDATPLNNLAVVMKEIGEIGEATRLLRRCVELKPASLEIHSNLILTLHYDPTATADDLKSAHEGWNSRHATPTRAYVNLPEPGRRLRLGFVSPDLRDHVVGRALLPSFRRLDPAHFELFCYGNTVADPISEEFRARCHTWRELGTKTAEQLAETIRADGVDILIDLALHTSDNRLDVFALKPAPLQVSWLGYPESSGLATMDYRLTDARLEPPTGNRLAHPHEQAWLLPDCWTCYEPPVGFPEVNASPASSGRPFTYGSFNNNCKINGDVLDAWARILLATPGSRLKLLAKQGTHRRRFVDELVRRGIEAERIQFADYVPAAAELSQGGLLARYHDIDVALDTFPYGGMTTTLDALWMGVPVVSLIGERNLGRAGLSLLSNVGLSEFATKDADGYVDVAVKLAHDLPRLADLRVSLRERMRASPILDAAGYTRKVEAAFRGMWLEWCRRQGKVA